MSLFCEVYLFKLVILFCNLVCVYVKLRIHIRCVRSSLAVVVFFMVKSKVSKIARGPILREDMKENIRTIFM